MTTDVLIVLGGYLLGSIPFGYVIPRLVRGDDVRRQGSGNVGASNVWRAYGPSLGVPVALLDVAKGFVPALVGLEIGGDWVGVLAGAAAMVGHARPVYLGFSKGGKMVATAGGVAFALAPLAALVCLAVWLVTFALLRYASLASMVTALALPLAVPRLRRVVADRRLHGRRRPRGARAPSSQHPSPARRHRAALLARSDPGTPLTGRWRRTAAGLAALVAVAVAAGTVAESAVAAPWCGTTTTEDRPPAVAGRSIRVVYAYPSDGLDRSAQLAPRISSDIDEIDAWWRGQDTLREPRFDRAAFSCGPQADILVVKLTDGAARLRASDRYDRITDTVLLATGRSQYEKELVYYDGPVDDVDACGEGAGRADGEGAGIVYLGACSDVPSAAVAAHELLHAFGALADSGPPHACPDTRGHPCDSTLDLLYPYASAVPLGSLALDVGHDDYYGHSGSWPDVQDSLWLRLVAQQLSLALAITGKGSVESDIPGIDCAASCADRLGRREHGLPGGPAGRRAAVRALVGIVHRVGPLRGEPSGGSVGRRALRSGTVRARALRLGPRRGLRRGHAVSRGPVSPHRDVLRPAASPGDACGGVAARRLERRVRRTLRRRARCR